MRKSVDLDPLLENAVAAALGIDRPHPELPNKIRTGHRRPLRRAHRLQPTSRRSPARRAA